MPPFDPDDTTNLSSRWKKWKRSFEIFLDVNNVALPSRKKSYLLHFAGEAVQDIYDSLVGAVEPPVPAGSDAYQEAMRVLDGHFLPMKCLPQERHIFRNLQQEPDEKISKFVLRLREQGNLCEYQDWLDENIKEQIFEKGSSDELRAKILTKPSMTLAEIINEGRSLETIEKVRQQLKHSGDINKISTSKNECFRCGRVGHYASDDCCPAKNKKCEKCGLIGHFRRCCKTKERESENQFSRQRNRRVRQVGEEASGLNESVYDSDDSSSDATETRHDVKYVFAADTDDTQAEKVICSIGGVKIKWIVDSGAGINVIDDDTWRYLKKHNDDVLSQTKESKRTLKAYGNNDLHVVGEFTANISTKHCSVVAEVVVVKDRGASLLSRETATRLNILSINTNVWKINADPNKIGTIKGFEVRLQINDSIKPVQHTKCHVPIPLQEKVQQEIDHLLEQDIIEAAPRDSPWISRLVVSPKAGDPSSVRLCVDMRAANKAIVPQHHPLPTFEDIVPHLNDCRWFSKIDLVKAFHQVPLAEDSRFITTFATHQGYYRYKRLTFGMNCASEVFQSIIERILKGIKYVRVFIDDIMVFAPTKHQHDATLREVIQRLEEYGITINLKKCEFGKPEVTFMGHVLSENGIKPTLDKVEAIRRLREPCTVEEVRSFLGTITYLGRFIPDLSTLTTPLRQLLRKDSKFVWGSPQKEAFQKIKDILVDPKSLGYYSPCDKTILIADASPTGLGGVLLQEKDGVKRVICYISKGLSDAEKSYAQNEKEALALVWATERLQIYLRGMEFLLLTDHEPLKVIFGPGHPSCPRIERWAMRLQSFRFQIVHIPGKVNIADSLSRLPKFKHCTTYDRIGEEAVLAIMEHAKPVALSMEELSTQSERDAILSDVKEAIRTGRWSDAVKKYAPFKEELYCYDQVLLRGDRLVVPSNLQKRVLRLAHIGHPGIERTKQRLRSKVWWPSMDRDVERAVKSCLDCQVVGKLVPAEPMEVRRMPENPWEVLHLDTLGPLPSGNSLLVIIDPYSRYRVIEVLRQTTSTDIVDRLRPLFMRLGIPNVIITDNARNFSSKVMEDFCGELGVKLRHTTPYWPQANGEVERQNRSILKVLRISELNKSNWKQDLEEYNYVYALTPHPATGYSPAELAFGRKFRDWIPHPFQLTGVLDAEVQDNDKAYKHNSKTYYDDTKGARESNLCVGDEVLMRNMNPANKLAANFHSQPARVLQKQGNSVVIETPTGERYRRNSSHLKKVYNESQGETADQDTEKESDDLLEWTTPPEQQRNTPGPSEQREGSTVETNGSVNGPVSIKLKRKVRQPLRFDDYILDLNQVAEQGV
ncbi:uncharacterized protein K02A2.6-like [Aedes albopictus]|uniref:RNA-directed DNA polymerase n=1 Tax=Aedes albopictus TaxID=7160 RepID=A0ABM1YG32_AEDAL